MILMTTKGLLLRNYAICVLRKGDTW